MQSRICAFFSEPCEIDDHSSCAETYEGMGILAQCSCTCHKGKQMKESPDSIQTTLDGMDGVANIEYNHRTR